MRENHFPPASSLPVIDGQPDPFLRPDGSRVQDPAEWPRQREYLIEMLEHYLFGQMPPAPGNVKGVITRSEEIYGGIAIRENAHITCGPDLAVGFDALIIRPNKEGRFPVFVWNAKPEQGSCPVEREVVCERGYVIAMFEKEHLAPDSGGYLSGCCGKAYPEYDWRALAMWAWGQSRLADYLLTTSYADADKLIATGHSRHGKASAWAAICDERFAAAAIPGSGCGGAGNFRRLGGRMGEDIGRAEKLEDMVSQKSFWYWLSDNTAGFEGKNIKKLPLDSHFIRALIAPRPLITLDGLDDAWANPLGVQVSWILSQTVYDFLSAPGNNAINFREGGHAYNEADWHSSLSFLDVTLLHKSTEQDYKLYSKEIDPPASDFCGWAK